MTFAANRSSLFRIAADTVLVRI